MARYAAKNLVAAGLADRVELQVAYVIGEADPVSILVDAKGTGKISNEALSQLVRRFFDFRPAAIIDHLKLRRPIYRRTAAYGHFGRREASFTWERTDVTAALRRAARRL
jgi:S-adenosylmethionine synthetase